MDANPNVRGPHNTPCQYCGAFHGVLCPWVSAIEYHSDGFSLRRVEFREAPGHDGPDPEARAYDFSRATLVDERFEKRGD